MSPFSKRYFEGKHGNGDHQVDHIHKEVSCGRPVEEARKVDENTRQCGQLKRIRNIQSVEWEFL